MIVGDEPGVTKRNQSSPTLFFSRAQKKNERCLYLSYLVLILTSNIIMKRVVVAQCSDVSLSLVYFVKKNNGGAPRPEEKSVRAI